MFNIALKLLWLHEYYFRDRSMFLREKDSVIRKHNIFIESLMSLLASLNIV